MSWLGTQVRALRTSLYGNAFLLMLNSAVGSGFGAVFWIVAARLYPESVVGLTAALILLTGFIASVGTLGLPIALIRFLPEMARDPERGRRMVNTSMTLASLLAMALGLTFVLGTDLWAPSLSFVRTNLPFFFVFVLLCGILATVPTIDGVAISCRKAQFVLGRNVIYNGLRASLPIAFVGIFVGAFGIFGLYFSFVLAALVGAVLALFVFIPRLLVSYRPMPEMGVDTLRPLFGFSIGNHVASLIGGIAPVVLPLLIIGLRSPVENAWFYVAWFLGTMLYVIPGAFVTSLYAEGSQPVVNLSRDVRRTAVGSALLILPAGLFLYFYGDWVLLLFGETYALGGFGLLRWMVLASPFVTISGIYLTLVRIEKRVGPLIAATAFTASFTLGVSWFLLPSYGLQAVGFAWFLSQVLVSVAVGVVLALGWVRFKE